MHPVCTCGATALAPAIRPSQPTRSHPLSVFSGRLFAALATAIVTLSVVSFAFTWTPQDAPGAVRTATRLALERGAALECSQSDGRLLCYAIEVPARR